MSRVVIVGMDWQSRTLLRAQLLEEGFATRAYENVSDAIAELNVRAGLPDLLVADLFASDDPEADITLLSEWAEKIPIWIIASRAYHLNATEPTRKFEKVMMRPVDLGELVSQIKQRLAPQA